MSRFLSGTILALLLLGGSAPAGAQVTFVLDASGSMWREADGTTRFDLARRALEVILEGIPDGTEAAMVAFGHRLRGDCFDVEVFPPSRDLRALVDISRGIVPKGETCLARAIRSVSGRSGSVVVLGDGGDGCREDACALAAALGERGDVRIHTLAFAPDPSGVLGLDCIADRARGFSAVVRSRSAAEREARRLLEVLTGRRPTSPVSSPSARTPAGQGGPSATPRGTGVVVLDLEPWIHPPAAWGLAEPESGIVRARTTSERLEAEAGRYQVFWEQRPSGSSRVYLSRLVDVIPGRARRGSPTTGVRFRVPEGIGPPYFWRLLDGAGEQAARTAGSLAPEPVPSGSYELRWKGSQHGHPELSFGKVHVERGRLNTLSLDGGIDVVLPEWLPAPYQFVLRGNGGERYRFRASGRSLFPPGRYRVFWQQTLHHHRPVEWGSVEVPEAGFVRIGVDSGIRFGPENGAPPFRVVAVPRAGGARGHLDESRGPLPLPPGRYEIRVRREKGDSWTTLGTDFRVERGRLLEIQLPESDQE